MAGEEEDDRNQHFPLELVGRWPERMKMAIKDEDELGWTKLPLELVM